MKGLAERLDGEVDEMWTALVEWAADDVPPRQWRRDIGLMANETVRRIAWLIASTPEAAVCWQVFEQHVVARDSVRQSEAGSGRCARPPARGSQGDGMTIAVANPSRRS